MITGIDWYEYQIKAKEKQLAHHRGLKEVYKDKDCGVDLDQMIYDDQQYLIMLKHSLKNEMWYKDDIEQCTDNVVINVNQADFLKHLIGWCADK